MQTLSTSAPLDASPAFTPFLLDGAFSIWSIWVSNNLKICILITYLHLLNSSQNNSLFPEIISSFVRKRYNQFPNLPEDTPLDSSLTQVPLMKGMILFMYCRIQSLSSPSLNLVKMLWEGDLGEEISEELWDDVLEHVHTSSICAKHGLLQCKVVHCIHWTKVRLMKIYDDADPSCEKCCQTPVNHVNKFWSCNPYTITGLRFLRPDEDHWDPY